MLLVNTKTWSEGELELTQNTLTPIGNIEFPTHPQSLDCGRRPGPCKHEENMHDDEEEERIVWVGVCSLIWGFPLYLFDCLIVKLDDGKFKFTQQ